MTNHPAAYLAAALTAREEAARALNQPPDWHQGPGEDPDWEEASGVYMWPPEHHTPYERDKHWRGFTVDDPALAAFIAANDPAAVLRRCAAERKILELHANVNDGDCAVCVVGEWGYPTHGGAHGAAWPCDTIRTLAEGHGWTPTGSETT